MSPIFLDVDDVIRLHFDQLKAFGGSGGIRDRGLLESAVAQPAATFGGDFLHESLSAMAAAYLLHIVMNHPFVDGNKRTGLAAAVVFLDLNGAAPAESATEHLFEATIAVAEGRLDKPTLAARLAQLPRSSSQP